MEHLEGGARQARLARGMALRGRAHRARVARGLAAAHEAGIVHRDLKPANVMLGRERQVKVLDFGIAKLVYEGRRRADRRRRPATIVGTPTYMSPEQIEGRPVDARSDVFAFGATLYEMPRLDGRSRSSPRS